MDKKLVSQSLKIGRILTSPIRRMPDFLIIGAQKCGTTSLFDFLVQHPNIGKPHKKEVDYYKPHNERLYQLININFNWDK
ncbi:sulfotransferase domain-containing protein [Pleurocapsa sp. PCC 7319]|uniref:sulfotransferase domain-containing protein n=1 Tax=Pleurocapsa sp. PCC 7319 TaxID=118161 RepID=UPI000348FF94|nr:sulfotransferase domain-containing protein [Pleurocapsa sp. PCC 7319]